MDPGGPGVLPNPALDPSETAGDSTWPSTRSGVTLRSCILALSHLNDPHNQEDWAQTTLLALWGHGPGLTQDPEWGGTP